MDWQRQLQAVFDASDEMEKQVASQRMLGFRGNRRAAPAPGWMEDLQTLWRGFTGAPALPEVWDTQHGIRDADALYRGPYGPAAAASKMQMAPNTLYPPGDVSQRTEDILNQFHGPAAPPSAQEREKLLWDLWSARTGLRT